jgi:hypothetical protein
VVRLADVRQVGGLGVRVLDFPPSGAGGSADLRTHAASSWGLRKPPASVPTPYEHVSASSVFSSYDAVRNGIEEGIYWNGR